MPDLHPFIEWLAPYATGALIYGIFSAAARSLPAPEPMGSRFYLFFYNFMHNLLANFDKTVKNVGPTDPSSQIR
jgi:hypothetical protein